MSAAPAVAVSQDGEREAIFCNELEGHAPGAFLDDESSRFHDTIVTKVRKPYTISKQRERWTNEEHEKFLEALKLYGRAWQRIEEHVATKTAVQIRSHAQKFFSKVEKEGSFSLSNGIDIPPPRPKRKPMHPYPRKKITASFGDSAMQLTLKSSGCENHNILVPQTEEVSNSCCRTCVPTVTNGSKNDLIIINGSQTQRVDVHCETSDTALNEVKELPNICTKPTEESTLPDSDMPDVQMQNNISPSEIFGSGLLANFYQMAFAFSGAMNGMTSPQNVTAPNLSEGNYATESRTGNVNDLSGLANFVTSHPYLNSLFMPWITHCGYGPLALAAAVAATTTTWPRIAFPPPLQLPLTPPCLSDNKNDTATETTTTAASLADALSSFASHELIVQPPVVPEARLLYKPIAKSTIVVNDNQQKGSLLNAASEDVKRSDNISNSKNTSFTTDEICTVNRNIQGNKPQRNSGSQDFNCEIDSENRKEDLVANEKMFRNLSSTGSSTSKRTAHSALQFEENEAQKLGDQLKFQNNWSLSKKTSSCVTDPSEECESSVGTKRSIRPHAGRSNQEATRHRNGHNGRNADKVRIEIAEVSNITPNDWQCISSCESSANQKAEISSIPLTDSNAEEAVKSDKAQREVASCAVRILSQESGYKKWPTDGSLIRHNTRTATKRNASENGEANSSTLCSKSEKTAAAAGNSECSSSAVKCRTEEYQLLHLEEQRAVGVLVNGRTSLMRSHIMDRSKAARTEHAGEGFVPYRRT